MTNPMICVFTNKTCADAKISVIEIHPANFLGHVKLYMGSQYKLRKKMDDTAT